MIKKIINKLLRLKKCVNYRKEYDTWNEAKMTCTGYDDEKIFTKVKNACEEVMAGNACYERDSVLFFEKEYNYSLLFWLNYVSFSYNGKLNMVDWGGSLGSTYFQNKELLEKVGIKYNWNIVEQKHFVEYGKEKINDSNISFYQEVKEITNKEETNCLLFGSVLQYLPECEKMVESILQDISPLIIIVERTPISEKSLITIEYVSEPIYSANYPIRIFTKKEICDMFDKKYILLNEEVSKMDTAGKVNNTEWNYQTLIFRRK